MKFWMICCATLWLIGFGPVQAGQEVTASEVYAQVQRIHDEVLILKRHFKITAEIKAPVLRATLTPGHTWQKTYEVLYKLNILREKHGLPMIAVPSRSPRLSVPRFYVYEQALRVLSELAIFKFWLDIQEVAPPLQSFTGKVPTDAYNLANQVSYELDLLNDLSFTPSHVFSQAMRISEDVLAILENLNIADNTIPPPKNKGVKPLGSYEAGLALLVEVIRIKGLAGLPSIDLNALQPQGTITPGEVFGLNGIILAELQPIKAQLEMFRSFTPTAEHYENKMPADVQQILGWSTRRLHLIKSLAK